MKYELKLILTATQYQQLVETMFVGEIRLSEDRWQTAKAGHGRLMQDILSQASIFGKESITFKPALSDQLSISKELESELLPYLFDE